MVKMVKRWPLWPGEVEICPSVQPDDPGLPRRLTREFPFGFRGGLSVHSHGPRVVCFFCIAAQSGFKLDKTKSYFKKSKSGAMAFWPMAQSLVCHETVSPRTHACILILENANDNPDKQLSH